MTTLSPILSPYDGTAKRCTDSSKHKAKRHTFEPKQRNISNAQATRKSKNNTHVIFNTNNNYYFNSKHCYHHYYPIISKFIKSPMVIAMTKGYILIIIPKFTLYVYIICHKLFSKRQNMIIITQKT